MPTIIGLIVSFIGSLYLFSGDAQGDLSQSSMIIGGLLIFMSGAFWSVYVIYSKSLIQSLWLGKTFAAVAGDCNIARLGIHIAEHLGNHDRP